MVKNKRGEHFSLALLVIIISIAVFSIGFLSENSSPTGLAVYDEDYASIDIDLIIYDNLDSLSALAAGNYYVDGNGIVYWVDDESKPPIAKVNSLSESQKNRRIFIDKEGNIGYLLG